MSITEPTPTAPLTLVDAELEKALVTSNLSPDGIQSLRQSFAPYFTKFHELAVAAEKIPATAPKTARAMRLELRAVRIAAEKTRKEQGEDALRRKKAIDGINNLLLYALTPIEERMDQIEKAEEIAEAKRKAELKETREKTLQPLGMDTSFYNLAEMPEDVFQQLLTNAKSAYQAKLDAAAKAEAERIARETAEREERERIRAENERLKKEAEERERVTAEERKRLAKEREEAADKLAAEQEKARKEREEIERKAKIAADIAAALAKKEKEAREKVEAQLKAQKEAEDKRLAEEAAAKKRAESVPEKEQLIAFAAKVRSLPIPTFKTEEGKAIGVTLVQQVNKFGQWIEAQAVKL